MTPLSSRPPSIEDDWTDEQIMLSFGAWQFVDTLPSNVITDVNPFGIEPWNAQENFWYLYNIRDPSASRGKAVVDNPSYGHWKDTRCNHPIFIDSQYLGTKITWKFVGQNALPNDNMCWIMFEYNLNANMKSLYKFLGRNSHVTVLEDRASELDEVPADFDFSNGDFLELKDLDDGADSSSSSSVNSSRVSLNSDDYFDSEALLRDLEHDNDQSVEGTRTNSTGPVSPSSSADSSSRQPGTSRVSRIKKLGKKYFCFAS